MTEPLQDDKLRVVIFGAHPDDPETGCGGLIATLTGAGHEVICAYATTFRPDREFFGRSEKEVREAEATAACAVLNATPKFFPYEHDVIAATPEIIDTVSDWLDEEQPDIVVTHWPLDSHPHHTAVSSILWQSYLRNDRWKLYFFEVLTFAQTTGFRPDFYLDIGAVREIKRTAVHCHKSQKPDDMWRDHDAMHRWRGNECGVEFAEAYVMPDPRKHRAFLPVPLLQRRS